MLETRVDIPTLYHFTCDHSAEKISNRLLPLTRLASPVDRQRLRNGPATPRWAGQVVWLTTLSDIDPSTKQACGLTNEITDCDRTSVRFVVLPGQDIHPWSTVRMLWPTTVVNELEAADGVRPETWWVCGGVVRVALAPRAVKVST